MKLNWGRADQLGLEMVLAVALVLVLVFGLGGPALVLLGHGSVTAAVELDRGAVHGVPHLVGSVQAQVEVVHPGVADKLLSVLPTALLSLLEAAVILLLLGVTRSARRAEVFVRATVHRLRIIALLIALGGTALEAVESVCRNELALRTGAADLGPSVTVTALPVVIGLLVAFLAEVVRRGTVLRDDLEGLV